MSKAAGEDARHAAPSLVDPFAIGNRVTRLYSSSLCAAPACSLHLEAMEHGRHCFTLFCKCFVSAKAKGSCFSRNRTPMIGG
eukprot:3112092-Prymnesium_polylepis.1